VACSESDVPDIMTKEIRRTKEVSDQSSESPRTKKKVPKVKSKSNAKGFVIRRVRNRKEQLPGPLVRSVQSSKE
jgi:hypothetical protein